MLFRCKSFLYKHVKNTILKRKETLSPLKNINGIPPKYTSENRRRAFFFAPLNAGMTVETAVALPVFFICMMAVLHFGNVMEASVRYGSALCETSEKMAAAAYVSEYGGKNTVLSVGLSAVYARSSVLGKAGISDAIKNTNFLMSSFLKEDDMIHLVMTYQVKAPVGGIRLPGVFFHPKSQCPRMDGEERLRGCRGGRYRLRGQ